MRGYESVDVNGRRRAEVTNNVDELGKYWCPRHRIETFDRRVDSSDVGWNRNVGEERIRIRSSHYSICRQSVGARWRCGEKKGRNEDRSNDHDPPCCMPL